MAGDGSITSPAIRVLSLSDIGNEPDDQMSFVRFLLYSNEIDVEGLVAATSTWQKTVSHPETLHHIITLYRQARPNLLKRGLELEMSGFGVYQVLSESVAR